MRKITVLIIIVAQILSGQVYFDQEPVVRVRIIHTLDSLIITVKDQWEIQEEGQIKKVFFPNETIQFFIQDGAIHALKDNKSIKIGTNKVLLKSNQPNGTLTIDDVPYGVGWWWEGSESRNYEGDIFIYRNNENKFDVVVKLMLEDYLKGVVPYEIGGDSPLEALKAQAVAARSEAIIALTSKLYSGAHYDLTSDVECQVFSGNKKRTANSDKAVVETKSIILTENDKPMNAYYASNCGGHSEKIKNVWPDRFRPDSYQQGYQDNAKNDPLNLTQESDVRKWIAASPDVYCNPKGDTELPTWSQKNFRWKRKYSIEELSKMLAGDKNIGKLLEINPLKRGISGRIYEAEFIFEKGRFKKTTELGIRQLWSPSLRSSCFVVNRVENQIILKGAGWGHGVGMCQSGAVAQAKIGRNFEDILNHYYKKARLTSIYKVK